MVTVNFGGVGSGGDVDPTFNQDGSLAPRDAVYMSAVPNLVLKASASSVSTTPAIGFVSQVVSISQVKVRMEKILTGFGGLVPPAPMFLGIAPGSITSVPPSTSGHVVQEVGIAVTSTDLLVRIDSDSTVNA